MKHYVLVGWPEIRDFIFHKRWNKCVFCGYRTYAVPLDLYEEVKHIPSTKNLLEEAANFISVATFKLGEDANENNIDDKLLLLAKNL